MDSHPSNLFFSTLFHLYLQFFAGRELVTVFSAPNYCGEFDNAGGMMLVNEKLVCSFRILRPAAHKKYYESAGGAP